MREDTDGKRVAQADSRLTRDIVGPDAGGAVLLFRPKAAPTEAPQRCMPASGELRVVGLRVDGLTLGVGVELDGDKLASWRELRGEPVAMCVRLLGWSADWSGSASGPGSVAVEVRRLREDRWQVRNGDFRALLEEHPLAGCELSVTFSAAFLATNSLDTARAYARSLAAAVGVVREMRLRRVDLAADVAGWVMRPGDREAWVARSRCKLTEFVDLPDEVHVHGTARRLTGFTVAPGGAVMARIYDKRAELADQSPEKREGEETIWRASGWDGAAAVTRVEFQLRSEALRTFGLVEPERLEGALDPLWQYLTREWLKLIAPTKANRSKCEADARWKLLQACQFTHASHPAARRFFRRGATAKHALGTWLSFVASHGATEGGELVWLPPGASEEEARAVLSEMARRWLVAGVETLCDRLVTLEGSAVAAVRYLTERAAVALARVADVGGGAEAPPPKEEGKRARKVRPRVELWREAA